MTLIAFLSSGVVTASEHHSGHGGGPKSSGGSASTCGKPQLAKFSPAHLANVAPESIFSFYAYNIDKPEYVSATVKNIPVELSAEFKDPFYLIKGKLPASLVDTAARINIKVTGKSPHCEAEDGWLLLIGHK
ncbi:MAG: hypothetical protein D0530_05440 [Methylococcales bacterium]|jgi:hypothetical protein|nr:MAG: hypothetical protein D0530_05440 [Methylococcales bacterium]